MSLTAEEIRNCTMIALDQPPFWPEKKVIGFQYTVDMSIIQGSPLHITPFMQLDGIIYWGDGEKTELHWNRVAYTFHNYPDFNKYQITIVGNLSYFSARYEGYYSNPGREIISIDTPFPETMSGFPGNPLGIFYNMANLSSIPNGLFENCYGLITLKNAFYNCKSLVNLPDGLFNGLRNVEDFGHCFDSCQGLVSLPDNLFANCAAAEDFSYCFYHCYALQNISSSIFSRCTAAESFSHCFENCNNLLILPDRLFEFCSNVLDFSYCFSSCSSLSDFSVHLFQNCHLAEDFSHCFEYCNGLKCLLIQDGGTVNRFSNLTHAKTFAYCFYQCRDLYLITDQMFAGCTAAEDFSYCFYLCGANHYPRDECIIYNSLFANCLSAKNFSYCFSGSSYCNISNTIFSGCTAAEDFSYCFQEVPLNELYFSVEGYFNTTPNAKDFSYCFSGSEFYNIYKDLFINCQLADSFDHCFDGCSNMGKIRTPGTYSDRRDAPELWLTHAYASHTDCFTGCIYAKNYTDIPEDWGGPTPSIP